MLKCRIWIACAICAAVSGILPAQTTSAEIQGTVLDSSRAVIPDAEVSVNNLATGIVRTTRSNAAGIYNVPDLPPSDYEMTVSAKGFAPQRRTGITLTVGAQQVLNVTLTLSAVPSSVEVTGAAAHVELRQI